MTCNPLIFLINFKSNGSNGVLGYTGSSTSWKPLICWDDVHDCQFQYNILFEVTKSDMPNVGQVSFEHCKFLIISYARQLLP